MNAMFRTHLLNDTGIAKAKAISDAFERLAELLPAGEPRCMAVARTHLETACFYSKKAIAVLPENQLGQEAIPTPPMR